MPRKKSETVNKFMPHVKSDTTYLVKLTTFENTPRVQLTCFNH